MSDKEIAIKNDTALNAEKLIARAIDKNVPVETMEKLLAMRTQLKEEYAREEYFKALAEFQAECPVIKKTKEVMNKENTAVRYRYAPLESIVGQIKILIEKHGFSYTVNAHADVGYQTAVCTIHHKAGHSESSEFKAPIDPKAYMNTIQSNMSSLTYAKRYAFCNAFGIMTGDEDNDAQSYDEPVREETGLTKPAKSNAYLAIEEEIVKYLIAPYFTGKLMYNEKEIDLNELKHDRMAHLNSKVYYMKDLKRMRDKIKDIAERAELKQPEDVERELSDDFDIHATEGNLSE